MEKERRKAPSLIVMLTKDDLTVKNAATVFEECKNSKAQYWGFKEKPLPVPEMKTLYQKMKSYGKTTLLEVVAYTEEECLKGAQVAIDCQCDILMGTFYFDSVNELCKKNHLKYMPFVGEIDGRPSVLKGSVEEMIATAKKYLEKGVYGFDLLGYRYVDDAVDLNKRFVEAVPAPVCIAGSIDSYQRLNEVKDASPWAFTIGSAFFENKFNGSFHEQVEKVCDYMSQKENNVC